MADYKTQQIEAYIGEVLEIMPSKYMSELAQYLIVCEIDLSDAIKNRLIELKQVSHVVGCYLTEDVQDVIGAVKFVETNPQAIKILVETDVNMAVYLLTMSNMAH